MKQIMTDHHMFPRSRFPELVHAKWNVKRTPEDQHRAWHTIFGDATPQEAIDEILKFWTPQEMRQDVLLSAVEMSHPSLWEYCKNYPQTNLPGGEDETDLHS